MSVSTKPIKLLFIALLTFFAVCLSAIPASATMNPANQGGSTGVLFFAEETDGAIYVGDFNNPPTAKSIYWQQNGSKVNLLAVTQSRIAWSSIYSNVGDQLRGKILISDVGVTAGTITTVTIPGTPDITSLSSDLFGERFYVTTSLGDIYSFKSDGTELTLAYDAVSGSSIETAIKDVNIGAWYDSYNSAFYFCQWGSSGKTWKSTSNGAILNTPTVLNSNPAAPTCDGLGVDPYDQKVFLVTVGGLFKTISADGATVSSIPVTLNGWGTTNPNRDTLPSNMFVSHATSKIYFTTELRVYEVNYDGTGLRELYLGNHLQGGFSTLAVYYGATLSNIDATAAALRPVPTSNNSQAVASNSNQLAATGTNGILLVTLFGVSLLVISIGAIFTIRKKH